MTGWATGRDGARRAKPDAAAARRGLAERAARQLIIARAADVLSGPAGLAAYLRTGLLDGPAAAMSLPLDIGDATDTIPAHLRRLVIARDRHCQFPGGCDQPAAACQPHHIIPRSKGGQDLPGQPAAAVHLPPPDRRPPVGLADRPEPRRDRHRDQPRPHPHPAQPQPTRPSGLSRRSVRSHPLHSSG